MVCGIFSFVFTEAFHIVSFFGKMLATPVFDGPSTSCLECGSGLLSEKGFFFFFF